MKVGIMQPYFMPYIGYWQLLAAVDRYVIYDDVNFIKRGWVNRNRILVNGQPGYFNVPMKGASQNKRICEVGVDTDPGLAERNLRILENAYRKAPYFDAVYGLMEEILSCGKDNLAEYLTESIKAVCGYLGIGTELVISSSLDKDCSLKGQDKVLEICRLLGADEYYNAIGGRELYSGGAFAEKGISLKFLQTDDLEYAQFGQGFVGNLSIIDVMMFNSVREIKEMLEKYTLVQGCKTGSGGVKNSFILRRAFRERRRAA